MSATRILNALKTNWISLRRLALACGLLLALISAPLQAQVTYQELFEFNCATGGCYPAATGALVQGSDGNLYGMTVNGGHYGYGTIFVATPSAPSVYTDLWPFDGPSGANPTSGLILGSDGKFYGTTPLGGTSGYGTLFSFTAPSTFMLLHEFTSAEGVPENPPVQGKDKNLYGVTAIGTVYRVTLLPKPTFKVLSGTAPGEPFAPLFLASDGNLYGTTEMGGTSNMGTVFRMTTPGGAITVIHNFSGPEGAHPYSLVIQGTDGYLYGTTTEGGANGAGEIYKMPLSGPPVPLYSFSSLNNFGYFPETGLAQGGDGNLYGDTLQGGANGFGTLFDVSTAGIFNKLFDFTGTGGTMPGSAPTTLMLHTNGSFYGGTFTGGSQDTGTLYSLTPLNLREILIVQGPIFLEPGLPVEILGNNLTQAFQVSFGSVPAQFQLGTDTYLTATVPNTAIDSPISVTLQTGLQMQTQMAMHILPMITNLDPSSGPVGTQVGIVGGGFDRASKVTFGGVKATNFTVVNPSLIQAIVPARAKTGKVAVTTPNGTATSKQKFTVN